MLLSFATLLLTQLLPVMAQDRPENATVCDFYTEKAVGENTAENQMTLMALVLHSALLGPFSKYNTVSVPNFVGALVSTIYQGEAVDLNGYFNGAFASANTGKDHGEAVNFFGSGGLAAARDLKPSNGDTKSAQHIFFTHVYSYFGTFLGCSHIGSAQLPAYTGKASMYEVHKYMDLNQAEMGFFIDQAVRGLLSFGFGDADAQFVNDTLNSVFNRRCSPAAAVIPPDAGPQLQAICIAPDCLLSANDTCSAYDPAMTPSVANATLIGNYSKAQDGSTTFDAPKTTPSSSGAGRLGEQGMDMLNLAITVAGTLLLALSLA
ncbi:hypothetical protein F4677DRAFT_449573 [Hypoxylon crocopeplum]|nr:hypothetical protein F4677DRAFT_449573 [Hypoxylon crocopeplum]